MRPIDSHDQIFDGLKSVMVHLLQARIDAAQGGTPPVDLDIASRILHFRQSPTASESGLVRVANALSLSDVDILALALCLAADDDPHVARLVARAQEPIGGSRPLIGLLASLLRQCGASPLSLANGHAVQSGILQLGDERAALPERSIYIPSHIAAAMAGVMHYPPDVQPHVALSVHFDDTAVAALDAGLAWLQGVQDTGSATQSIIVRSASGRECAAIAGRIAQSCNMVPVRMDASAIAQQAGWLMASAAIPVVAISGGPGDRITIDSAYPYRGPIIICTAPDTQVDAGAVHFDMRIATPDQSARSTLWMRHGFSAHVAQRAAQTYRHSAGRIADLAHAVQAPADNPADWTHLAEAVQSSHTPLDGLARRLRANVARTDLVLPDASLAELERLVARISLRNGLATGLGSALQARYSPGVRALFTGESGTGKTLAAHWMSHQTGLPLYRVDQAALTSKWIGETEKNLATILDAAQNADVILFFDEADALFGARTDVRDANDRHANAQTNYLLQRIEDYEGVVILATNNRDRFDPAFVRRLDMIMAFPMPDTDARLQLWRVMLGTGHGLTAKDLATLAMGVDLAGGHIRNIILEAAVSARQRGAKINSADIAAATALEFAKLGRPAPMLFA